MFTPVSSRAATAYRQVGVQSLVADASPHMLIKMLFDGLVQTLFAAQGALQRGDIEEKGRHLGKAVRIIEEGLKAGLNKDQGGEIAANLASLYDYCGQRLTLANLKNDVSMIEEILGLIGPIAQSWEQIGTGASVASQSRGV